MDVITFFSILKKSSFLNYAKVNKINSSNFLIAVSNVFQQFIYSVLVNKKWSFKIFAIAIFIMPYIANSNSENNVITKYFANPVLDLNSVNAGVDHVVQFIPTTGNLSPMSVIPTLSSDTNSILSAVVSFSGEIDPTEFLYSTNGPFQFNFDTANSTNDFSVNSITIRVVQNFTTFTITELAGNPISNSDFLDFLNTLFYRNATNTATPGVRIANIEVTDPNLATASAQNIIRVYNNGPNVVDEANSVLANNAGIITGNVLTNDSGNSITVSEVDVYPGQVGNSYQTLYGSITIQSNGSYSYDVDETSSSVIGLKNGESLDDIISYTVKDNADIIDYGILTITINGVDEAPVALDNNTSITAVTETDVSGNVITDIGPSGADFIDRGLSTLVWETEFSTGGGVFGGISGPVDGETKIVDGITLDFTSADPSNIGVADQNQTVFQVGTNGGHSGYLLYSIDASTNPSSDTELIIDFDEPVFNLGFLVVDIDFSQAPVWQDQITINGTLDGVVSNFTYVTTGGVVDAGSNTFYGTGNAIESDATGNVNVLFEEPINQLRLSYNYGPNATNPDQGGQIAGISDIYWQGIASNIIVLEIDGNPVSVGSSFVGMYGTIVVNPDGSYVYTPDTSNPAVAGLLTGQSLTETFNYLLTDGSNSSAADLIIDINGDKTAPTITISTPIEGDNIVDDTEDQDVTITGTTTDVEDGQVVTVTFSDGTNTVTTTATVTGGIWTATDADISGLTDGPITVTADVTDFGGNPATDSQSVTLGTTIIDPCDVSTYSDLDCDGDGVTNGDEISDGTDPTDPCDYDSANITLTQSGDYLAADCDGDGESNGDELTNGTDPSDPCEGGSLPNVDLANTTSDWYVADCDGDGVINGTEVDPDMDGNSGPGNTDPIDPCDFNDSDLSLAPSGDYLLADCDGDGVTNGDEITDGTDPADPCDYDSANITLSQSGDYLTADCDGDGESNGDELTNGTDPSDPCEGGSLPNVDLTNTTSDWYVADCDGDGVINGTEVDPDMDGNSGPGNTDPYDSCDFNVSDISVAPGGDYLVEDCDGDGVTNGDEITDGTDPADPCDYDSANITLSQSGDYLTADCDGDGENNGDELTNGTDPTDPCEGGSLPNVDLTDTTSDWYISDCDGDGVINGTEVDPDRDGTSGPDNTDPNDPCDYDVSSVTVAVTSTVDCDG
uniref:VCBS domain-containing protein n=1 Tax=Olleya sp. ITB9 TaxID=1715648 RepID=UPI000A4B40A0